MSLSAPARAWTKVGVAALPLYGLLLANATLTPEPDQTVDPEAWARFVTSGSYLAGHVSANIVGAALVIFGTFALGVVLARGRAPRLGLAGMVVAVIGQILLMVPGAISTFATPAVGAAYLRGNEAVMALEFSPAFSAIVVVALLSAVVGNLVLGVAIWRSGSLPRGAGGIWLAATLVFYVLGAVLGMATTGASLPTQPIGAVLLAVSGGWIAWTVIREGAPLTAATAR
jgi:hypothetical protein